MRPLRFTKMQGIGNDFMIVDGLTQDVSMSPSQISQLASRTTGWGSISCWLSRHPPIPVQTSSIESITPMAQPPGNAAMARAASQSTCTISASIQSGPSPCRPKPSATTKRLSANEFKVSLEAPQFDPEIIPFKPTGQSPKGSKWSFEPPGQAPVQFGVQRR